LTRNKLKQQPRKQLQSGVIGSGGFIVDPKARKFLSLIHDERLNKSHVLSFESVGLLYSFDFQNSNQPLSCNFEKVEGQ
jgi:hypothetical protein